MSVYGTTVLEHFRRPRNQRSLDHATGSHEGFNKQCGDRVRIEVEVDGETIRAAAFSANACAICTAAASLLSEQVPGALVSAALALAPETLLETLGAEVPAGRKSCATLPLETLHRALNPSA
jgi:NifU-like protein involved in Fe-S cluster formation